MDTEDGHGLCYLVTVQSKQTFLRVNKVISEIHSALYQRCVQAETMVSKVRCSPSLSSAQLLVYKNATPSWWRQPSQSQGHCVLLRGSRCPGSPLSTLLSRLCSMQHLTFLHSEPETGRAGIFTDWGPVKNCDFTAQGIGAIWLPACILTFLQHIASMVMVAFIILVMCGEHRCSSWCS